MAKILLAGATGLIGGELASLLAASGHKLHVIGRRHSGELPPSIEQHIFSNEKWPDTIVTLGADIAISCLGTTMKQAGSKEAFAAVDFDLLTAFAKAAKAGGAKQMLSVSSVGASTRASNFYLQTKGRAEDSLTNTGFARLDIMRPGLLRGERDGPSRFGESLAIIASPFTDLLLHGPMTRYRSVAAADVARAMAALIGAKDTGKFIHENDEIRALSS